MKMDEAMKDPKVLEAHQQARDSLAGFILHNLKTPGDLPPGGSAEKADGSLLVLLNAHASAAGAIPSTNMWVYGGVTKELADAKLNEEEKAAVAQAIPISPRLMIETTTPLHAASLAAYKLNMDTELEPYSYFFDRRGEQVRPGLIPARTLMLQSFEYECDLVHPDIVSFPRDSILLLIAAQAHALEGCLYGVCRSGVVVTRPSVDRFSVYCHIRLFVDKQVDTRAALASWFGSKKEGANGTV